MPFVVVQMIHDGGVVTVVVVIVVAGMVVMVVVKEATAPPRHTLSRLLKLTRYYRFSAMQVYLHKQPRVFTIMNGCGCCSYFLSRNFTLSQYLTSLYRYRYLENISVYLHRVPEAP